MELIFFFVISLLTTYTEGQYDLVDDDSVSSNFHCKLGQPPLTFGKSAITTDISDITTDDEIWVGYYKAFAGLDYIGCATTAEVIDISRQLNAIEEHPGFCYSACNSSFGITKGTCYCLPDHYEQNQSINITWSQCTDMCSDQAGVLCGGSDKDMRFASIYSPVRQNTYNGTVATECLHVNPSSWDNCTKIYKFMCYNGTNLLPKDLFGDWQSSAKYCLAENHMPAPYRSLVLVKPDVQGSQLWTGVIRSEVIFTADEFPNNSNLMRGYLMQSGNHYVLSFSSYLTGRKYLCLKDISTTTASSITSTRTTMSDGTITDPLPSSTDPPRTTVAGKGTSITASPDSSGFTPSTNTSSSTNPKSRAELKSENNVGVPVGISVSTVLIVAAVVTLIVLIRKRKLSIPYPFNALKGRKKDKANIRKDFTRKNNNINQLCDSEQQQQDSNTNTYHVLEKEHDMDSDINTASKKSHQAESDYNYPDMTEFIQEKINDQSDDLGHGQNDHTYFVLKERQNVAESDDGTYNVTGVQNVKTLQKTDNIYNKLDEENNATYDHLGKQIPVSSSKGLGSDNTFDSEKNATRVLKPGEELDSVYNHVSGVEESGSYDHVNHVAFETKRADNIYGVPGKPLIEHK